MSVEFRHDVAPGLPLALTYLLAQQQAQQRQQPPAVTTDPVQQAALQQLLQSIGGQQGGAMPANGTSQRPSPAGFDPLEKYKIDAELAARRATAGATWLANQGAQASDFMRDQTKQWAARDIATQESQDALTKAEMGWQASAREQQAKFAHDQTMAAMQSNLEQANKLTQLSPGVIDPGQYADVQERVRRNQEVLTLPEQAARQKLMEGIAAGDPEAIRRGLAEGVLYFSPEQKTYIRQLQESMSALDRNQQLTPAEKAEARARLAEEIHSVMPMQTPVEKLPSGPLEEFSKNTVTVPHQGGGPPLTYKKTFRNGVEGYELDDSSAADLKRWNDQQLELWKKENGIDIEDPAIKQQEMQMKQQEHQTKMFASVLEAKTKAIQGIQDLQMQIITAKTNLIAAQATPDATDDTVAQAELDLINGQIKSLWGQLGYYDQLMEQAKSGKENPATPLASAAGMPPQGVTSEMYPGQQLPEGGPPEWYLQLPSGSKYTDPNGVERVKQ